MNNARTVTAPGLTAAAIGASIATAAPASAGGIGDFLSPAFGVNRANRNNGAHANGTTTQGAGAIGGNIAGIPIGSAGRLGGHRG
ncbi:hypothetical protein ACQEVM_36535 [Streptomyces sp. CA-243310]|uniref:hypothetical protein n=1 Tax=Streptomyces sp. CA-243310 TaxID=3240056 RepID=UPI003D9159D5